MESKIENLKRQHQELGELLKEINNLLNINSIQENYNTLSILISDFVGKLKVHLVSEDKYLYPILLKNSNIIISNLAKEFIEEMGELSHQIDLSRMKWNRISDVINTPLLFVEDTRTIINNVNRRIAKEELMLFPKSEM